MMSLRRIAAALLLFGLPGALLPVSTVHAQGSVQMSAEVGIGGRYRPGGWVPITVRVVNGGTDTVQGQIQITLMDSGSGQGPDATFAHPVDVPPGPTPQYVQVSERGLDPGSQDVAASLVGGARRGDGATWAQITSQAGISRNAFSGLPVSPDDLLLVGLSADSTAITRLTGQQWGLMHTPGGVMRVPQALLNGPGRPSAAPTSPPTVQAAAAVPADLPDRPAGYGGVDAVLLRADAPLDALTEAQTDALKGWVAGGGHLIVCGGADPTPYDDPFYTGLLPARLASPTLNSGTAGLTLTPKPLPGVHVLTAGGGPPIAVTGPYGVGCVTILAADPASTPGTPWRAILADAATSLIGVAVAQETDDRYFYSGGVGQLSDTVLRAPSLDAPGAGVVGLFLVGYVLILVPLNYLVLRRLDKKEWSWATIPALVVVCATVTYGVGDAAKGNSVFINRATVLETTVGRREAGVFAAVGLFSPRHASYDLTLADAEALASDPLTPTARFFYGQPAQGSVPSGPAQFVEGGDGMRVQDAAANMWAMRAFDVQSATDMGGAVTAALTHDPQTGMVSGRVSNGTPHGLTGCHLFLNGWWQPLPDLPPHGSAPVASVFPASAVGAAPPVWSQSSGTSAAPGDVRQRMQAALGQFVGGLGAGGANGIQLFSSGSPPPAFFQPRPNEAILTGFCDDPGLAGPLVRVDGHPATQNAVTCVVVHIPLH